jgi:hypothetical protein
MAVVPDAGEPLSPQAADLVRRIARGVLDEPADLMAEVQAAVSAAADEPLRSEPVLAAEVAASTQANVLHWADGMERDPGGRVPANLSPEVLGIAREAFRRGIEQTVYTTYHAGQNAVWAYWMRTAFALSSDPVALRQALAAGSTSLAGFVDDMVAALSEQLRRERAELARSSHARRFEVVSLILDSAPITTGRAGSQLGYDLRRRHTAAVIWTDPRHPDQAALAQAAEALGPATRARQVLTVIASSSSVWAWLAAAADTGAGAITAATAAHPTVRIAVGPAGGGADGFRRSHFDAVATQRLMSRRSPGSLMSSWSPSPSRTSSAPASSSPGRSARWPAPTASCATPWACTSASSSAPRAPPAPCTPTATPSSTASTAPNGCSRSRWPATASKSAPRLRSPSGWAPHPNLAAPPPRTTRGHPDGASPHPSPHPPRVRRCPSRPHR